MARFGRGFGNDYDREFGPRRDWGDNGDRWGAGSGYNPGGGWPRNDRSFANDQGFGQGGYSGGGRYDRTVRHFVPGGYDRGFRNVEPRYDRGFRSSGGGNWGGGYAGNQWGNQGREPFPTRPSASSHPMSGRGSGYDQGFFGEEYDRQMRGSQRNFGDFRNSYLGPWF